MLGLFLIVRRAPPPFAGGGCTTVCWPGGGPKLPSAPAELRCPCPERCGEGMPKLARGASIEADTPPSSASASAGCILVIAPISSVESSTGKRLALLLLSITSSAPPTLVTWPSRPTTEIRFSNFLRKSDFAAGAIDGQARKVLSRSPRRLGLRTRLEVAFVI